MNNSFLLLVLTLFLCDVEGKDLVSPHWGKSNFLSRNSLDFVFLKNVVVKKSHFENVNFVKIHTLKM